MDTDDEISVCDVTISYLEPGERSYPADCFRISQEGGRSWVMTYKELDTFYIELHTFLRMHRHWSEDDNA